MYRIDKMPCMIRCSISILFLVAMIYFYTMTEKNGVIQKYKASLSPDLKNRFEKITQERKTISLQGYVLGLLISLGILFYYTQTRPTKVNSLFLVCTVISTMFVTNYFYYTLMPKSDWMLNHVHNRAEVDAWLKMYKQMQYNYHLGFVFGIAAVGLFSYAFV